MTASAGANACLVCRGKNEVPGGRRCDTHLKELTEFDLLPDNTPDGAVPQPQWAGEAPAHLYAQFHKQVANAALNALLKARDEEHAMTTGLFAAIEPAELAGLEFRLKAPTSLARKIATKAEERQITPKQAAATLEDTIRYTVTTPRAADVIPTLTATVRTLTRDGWTVLKAEHSFVKGNPYKGIHLILAGPGGHKCEVQFHTTAAYTIKERGHADYETYRDIEAPTATRKAAFARSVKRWNNVMTPPGLRKLTILAGVTFDIKDYRTKEWA